MNYRQFRDPAELGGYVFLKMPFLVDSMEQNDGPKADFWRRMDEFHTVW